MDSTDLQLIALLRQDARASVALLAKKLGVSRGTITNRIRRLEDTGVLVGYRAAAARYPDRAHHRVDEHCGGRQPDTRGHCHAAG